MLSRAFHQLLVVVYLLVLAGCSDPNRAAAPDDDYFERHLAEQDNYRFGATMWTWREACGDPRHQLDSMVRRNALLRARRRRPLVNPHHAMNEAPNRQRVQRRYGAANLD